MESNKIQFTVAADDQAALERAISYVNLQSESDFSLIKYEMHEVGLGTIEVSADKIKPEFLFLMGHRYKTLCKTTTLNFSIEQEE
ncbi:MAG TPA: hypothetical protein PLL53_18930 [Saprospiraceae bacterium]|nr:hypothetical protein [Saprospiraceae bacterium]